MKITAGIVAAVALVLAVAAATVAGLQPQMIAPLQQLMSNQQQLIVKIQLRVDQLMVARAKSPFNIDSTQTQQSSTAQNILTVSSSKPGQTQGETSQGHVSPTTPKEFPPPGRELTQDERDRILQGIHDLNIKTGEQYKK